MRLNRLERMGLEIACRDLVGGPGLAMMLAAMVAEAPAIVTKDRLAMMRTRHHARKPGFIPGKVVRARICELRARLKDVGFPNVIVSFIVEGSTCGETRGYFITERDAARIVERLTA